MAFDTLEIFGDEYTGVAGFKATDDNGIVKTYIRPQGTKSISTNGIGIDVTEYASVDVSISPNLQNKSVTIVPTESSQTRTIQADFPTYDGLDTVSIVVDPISSLYIGSDVPQRTSSNLSVSGATVTAPAGYYASNATTSITSGTEGTPVATKGTVSNHSISVTPSVTNTGGYISGTTKTGTAVTVTASELVSGTKSISSNGSNIDVTEYAAVNVSVSPSLQSATKSYTPTESVQSDTVSPGTGYDGLSSVAISIAAIPSTYVGSAITYRDSSDLSASGSTVSVPSGYYENPASKSIASGSATPAATISATGATLSSGTNTITLNKSVSNTPQVSSGYVSAGTAGNSNVSLTATVTTQGAQTLYPSTSDQSIASGRYLTGNQTIKAVAVNNLTADNIKNGVTVTVGDSTNPSRVMSVIGTYSGESAKNVQGYLGYATRTANSYGATTVTLTVAKTGVYKVSWCAWRSSSSGTMGTNLHRNNTSGTNQQTFTGTYGQCITLNNQSYTQGDVLTLYATSGSTSRSIYVGNLIIEEV